MNLWLEQFFLCVSGFSCEIPLRSTGEIEKNAHNNFGLFLGNLCFDATFYLTDFLSTQRTAQKRKERE